MHWQFYEQQCLGATQELTIVDYLAHLVNFGNLHCYATTAIMLASIRQDARPSDGSSLA